MAGVAPGTRERQAAPREATPPAFAEEDIASLLMSGDEDDSDVEGDADEDGDDLELGPDAGDEDDEDGEGGDSDAEADGEPGTDGEASSAAEGPDSYVDAWAAKVLAKPGLLAQVAPNRRTAVLSKYGDLREAAGKAAGSHELVNAANQAIQRAYDEGIEWARAQAVASEEFAELEELAETDPAEFGRMTREEPGKVKRYLEHLEAEKNPKGASAVDSVKSSMNEVAERVRGDEFATNHLRQLNKQYPFTAAGLADFSMDVAEALSASKAEAARKAKEPTKKAAEARAAAAEQRRTLPRVSGGGAGRGSGGADFALTNSAHDDLRAGLREEMKGRK